jgi:hypothetical protein
VVDISYSVEASANISEETVIPSWRLSPAPTGC